MAAVPPRTPQGPPISEDERADILLFLKQLEDVASWAAHNRESAVPEYLRQSLVAAWDAAEPRFSALADSIKSGAIDAELKAHGLTGPELSFKLLSFRAYYLAWSRLRDKRQHSGPGPLARLLRIIRRSPVSSAVARTPIEQ
jgi:hypothetical protein